MSKIEWTDVTWNPLAGCTPISPGCTHCYAATMAKRLEAMGNAKYIGTAERRGDVDVFTGRINLDEGSLMDPLAWKKPRMVFVNSMSDLFHEAVPFEFVDKVFAVMASCGQHAFQVLTKRPGRMAEYLRRVSALGPVHQNYYTSGLIDFYSRHSVDLTRPYQVPAAPTPELRFLYDSANGIDPKTRIEDRKHSMPECHWRKWPLDNVWLGTSCEDQRRADERIPHLLQCPAVVRFISAEPLVGPINLQRSCTIACPNNRQCQVDERSHHRIVRDSSEGGMWVECACSRLNHLNWVICGGESGHGARPMHPDWARSLRDQCQAAEVAFHFKQWGEWLPHAGRSDEPIEFGNCSRHDYPDRFGCFNGGSFEIGNAAHQPSFLRVGKKAAGRLLDGRTWDEFPTAKAVIA